VSREQQSGFLEKGKKSGAKEQNDRLILAAATLIVTKKD
jgi:hypothetical protein